MWRAAAPLAVAVFLVGGSEASAADTRVTRDDTAGSYGGLLGPAEAEEVECSTRRRQQQEPSVAVNPHNPAVVAVGAMDTCIAVRSPLPIPMAQNWLSYYRSPDRGESWQATLLPGYPGDPSPGRPAAGCTQQADPTLAFDRRGRLFYGALCPIFEGFGPVDFRIAVATYGGDGTRHLRTVRVDRPAKGRRELDFASDKPNLAVDQSTGRYGGRVYVAWTECRRLGPAPCNRYQDDAVVRVSHSANSGKRFSAPITLRPKSLSFPFFTDVAIAPGGAVYVTFRTDVAGAAKAGIWLARSRDGGETFTPARRVQNVRVLDSSSFAGSGSTSSNCGDGTYACPGGFTFPFMRSFSAVAADRRGVHVAWGGRTAGGQGRIFVRTSPDGIRWPAKPVAVDAVPSGHQWWPDIASSGGVLSVVYLDSRTDPAYAPGRPPGNTADGASSGPAVDTWVSQSRDGGMTWAATRLTSAASAPNFETFLDARLPWRGDYLSVSAVPGGSYATWPDSRDVVAGTDTRADSEANGFDVLAPCSWAPNTVSPAGPYTEPSPDDQCLSQGGLDTNVYGAALP
jgi:hypothetical protein